MNPISNHLVTASENLSPLEILHAPTDVLLGVTPQAVTALKSLDIHTVFDLASSRIFANASLLLDAGTDPRSMMARFGIAPADTIDVLPPGVSIDQLRFHSIEILEGIGNANAPGLSAALNVTTVRDLALWPPYLTAKEIQRTVFFPDSLPEADKDAPADLLPKSGEFPTERVFYSTLVFDGFDGEPEQLMALENAEPIDLAPVAGNQFGFKRTGIGALLTMSQSWYAQAVALGQLLHSVALAPAESTRIAMLDWSRRTVGKQSEDVTETEHLTNITEHSRALAEVTNAVAKEAQSGFSTTNVTSTSTQEGSGLGIGIGPVTIGDTSADASSNSQAMSFSSSSGQRELAASMTQNVVDKTQQYANAARNRRATVVKEVSQSEHETISTRVITNYNHMHALSIQYYEVVQIYRVAVQLVRVEKCLFIPMQLVDFTKPELVRFFREILLKAPIDENARTLLSTDYDTVDVKTLGPGMLSLKNSTLIPTTTKAKGKVVSLPNEAKVTSFYLMSGGSSISVTLLRRDGSTADLDQTDKQNVKVRDTVLIHEIESISMTNLEKAELNFLTAITFMYKGVPFGIDVQIKLPVGAAPQKILTFTGGGIRSQLVTHLQANRLYYSQLIFKSLDPATLILLLSGYSYRGKPVATIVDPQPVTTAGNYLVFRMHITPANNGDDVEEAAWAQWLEEHGVSFEHVKEDLVPLPSGGVFAEAVLGRYNSAEKLDITRFWNWQDSPIPIQAPEIAPIQMASRGESEDLKAGGFSQPLVNIVSPTSLPEPTGLGATIQAIANGNMFRDMSGLAATIGMAQAGQQTASDAATAASVQAGFNLATAAKKQVEMFKAALAFAGAMMGGGSADTSPSTISNEGAKINHGRNLDSRGVPTSGQPGGGHTGISTPSPLGGNNQAGGTPIPGEHSSQNDIVNGGSHEASAFNRSLWGQRGESQGTSLQNLMQPIAAGDEIPLTGDTKNDFYVFIYGLSAKGTSRVINTPLGINPGGRFNNAVDISAKNMLSFPQEENPELIRHTRFRWRQTASQTGFQKIGNDWKQVYHSIGSFSDDPDPQLQKEQDNRGWLYMFDSPGWPSLIGPSVRKLDLGGGIKSDLQATEVVSKMIFITWVEGLNKSGAWERVSTEYFDWCSIQWLKRANPTSDWQTTPNSKVVFGINTRKRPARLMKVVKAAPLLPRSSFSTWTTTS